MKMQNAQVDAWVAAGGRLSVPYKKRRGLPALFPYMRAQGKEGVQFGALLWVIVLFSLPIVTLKVVEASLQPRGPYLTKGNPSLSMSPTLETQSTPSSPIYGYGMYTNTPPSVAMATDEAAPWLTGEPCLPPRCGIVENTVLTPRFPGAGGSLAGAAYKVTNTPPAVLSAPRANVPPPRYGSGGSSVIVLGSGSLPNVTIPVYAIPTLNISTGVPYVPSSTAVIIVVTATPYPTASALPSATQTATVDHVTQTATASPVATLTGTPTYTASPSATLTETSTPTPTETTTLEAGSGSEGD